MNVTPSREELKQENFTLNYRLEWTRNRLSDAEAKLRTLGAESFSPKDLHQMVMSGASFPKKKRGSK